MSLETITGAVQFVIDSGLVQSTLSIVWHAGEPLVLPTSYYEEAFEAVDRVVQGHFKISHSFQSNGIRIDDAWCEFFKRYPVRIGLSIDGPAFLHDRHRKTRTGKPTHELTMLGAKKLQEHGIQFHVIAVISDDSLEHAESIYRFFETLGATEVGFNIEELEGHHRSSSLNGEQPMDRLSRFWDQLYALYDSGDGSVPVREFRKAAQAILTTKIPAPWSETASRNDQVLPFRIISVDHEGRISTFSPELLGTRDNRYNDFSFGRIGNDTLATLGNSESFMQVATEVMRGVEKCSRTCEYFAVCGGGAPSNKYFENGDFTSTSTLYCRASVQLPIRSVLSGLERKLIVLS